MMGELKPCPFCGSDRVEVRGLDDLRWVDCMHCGATGPCGKGVRGVRRPVVEVGTELAAVAWNRRAVA